MVNNIFCRVYASISFVKIFLLIFNVLLCGNLFFLTVNNLSWIMNPGAIDVFLFIVLTQCCIS